MNTNNYDTLSILSFGGSKLHLDVCQQISVESVTYIILGIHSYARKFILIAKQ